MVTRFGMSDIGPLSLEGQNTEVFLGNNLMSRSEYSEEIAARIDHQVREIVSQCYQSTLNLIYENRAAIDRIVDILIEKETMDGEEFRQIVAEYTAVPEKERYVPQL